MYAFRCSMLHQYSDVTKGQWIMERIGKFKLTVNNGHLNYNCDVTPEEIADGDVLHIDVERFCIEVCEAAKLWANKNQQLLKSKNTALILTY